jgi:hypothetical protein
MAVEVSILSSPFMRNYSMHAYVPITLLTESSASSQVTPTTAAVGRATNRLTLCITKISSSRTSLLLCEDKCRLLCVNSVSELSNNPHPQKSTFAADILSLTKPRTT